MVMPWWNLQALSLGLEVNDVSDIAGLNIVCYMISAVIMGIYHDDIKHFEWVKMCWIS